MIFPRCRSISKYSSIDIVGNLWLGPNTWLWNLARSPASEGRIVNGLRGCYFINQIFFTEPIEIQLLTFPVRSNNGPLPSGPPGTRISNFHISFSFSFWFTLESSMSLGGEWIGLGGAFRRSSSSCFMLCSCVFDWTYNRRRRRRIVSRRISSTAESNSSPSFFVDEGEGRREDRRSKSVKVSSDTGICLCPLSFRSFCTSTSQSPWKGTTR